MFRVGIGHDTHRLVEGRPLILAGVRVEAPRGGEGHSDADAVAHALTDAILGALADGDIGAHFPDSDPRWKNADSLQLLAHVVARAAARGYRVSNADATVLLERPKLRPYIDQMRANLAHTLGVELDAEGTLTSNSSPQEEEGSSASSYRNSHFSPPDALTVKGPLTRPR